MSAMITPSQKSHISLLTTNCLGQSSMSMELLQSWTGMKSSKLRGVRE